MCGGSYVKIAIFTLLFILQAAFTAGAFGKIRVHPMETSFNRGDNLTLNCSVEQGGPADVIFWYKGDKPIPFYKESNQSQWAEVSLVDVTTNDVGQYRCVVEKGSQSDSYVFELHVNGIPRINGVHKREILMQGEDKQISCKADGWPLPTLRWIRSNSEMIDQNDQNFHLKNSTGELVLQIKSASQEHQGCYTCVASNTFGEDRKTVNISVHAKTKAQGPEIRVEKQYVIAEEGWNLTLNCEAYYTVWYLSAWKWKLNGREIVNDHKQHYVQETIDYDERMTLVLKIRNLSQQDGGNYTCEVVTQQGFDQDNITLIIEDKGNLQNISTKQKTVEVKVGTQGKLQCVASYPRFIKATKWWTFRGRHLDHTDSRYGMDGYAVGYTGFSRKHSGFMRAHKMSLWISNVTESDFGNYDCVLNTSLGSSMETILLLPEANNKDDVASGKGNTTVLVLLFPLLAFGLLISITGYLLLRKMWRKQNHTRLREKVNEGEFVYDVFVTYSNRDRHWVTEKLMPLLEKQRLKCCIHSRDFELGRALVDNMAESVYSSRKVLAVLSRNYMDSRFCREELDMALHRSKVGHDCSLMVIRIDGIQKSKLPKALRDKTFLDFQDCKDNSGFEKGLMRFLVNQPETTGKINNTFL